jgi:hypothetical protein
MMSGRGVQTNRERVTRAGPRAATPGQAFAQRPVSTPEPWDEEQVALAHDLAVLITQGLIVAVSDGPEICYAISDGEEVLS